MVQTILDLAKRDEPKGTKYEVLRTPKPKVVQVDQYYIAIKKTFYNGTFEDSCLVEAQKHPEAKEPTINFRGCMH